MEEKEKTEARLLTKAGLREALMTRGAIDEHRKSGNVLNYFKGWVVFGIEGEVLGMATECWLDSETGDLWCHYRPIPPLSLSSISQAPAPHVRAE